mmetsp:Transcript_2602/g.4363  ORF Transcript_2602/g.4363 Transcript_2602/m.4363 type:complete len:113 (-) Transcript_2602:1288-1626(-)
MKISKQIDQLERQEDGANQEQIKKQISELHSQIPPQASSDKMKECPFCLRKFLEHVAERHMPVCEKTKYRAKPPPTKDQVEKKKDLRRSIHLKMASPKPSLGRNNDQRMPSN